VGDGGDELGFEPFEILEAGDVLKKGDDALVLSCFVDDDGLTGPVVDGILAVLEFEQKVAVRGFAQLLLAGQEQAAQPGVGDHLLDRSALHPGSRVAEHLRGGEVHKHHLVLRIGDDKGLIDAGDDGLGFVFFRDQLVDVHLFVGAQAFGHLVEFARKLGEFIVGGDVDLLVELAAADEADGARQGRSRPDDVAGDLGVGPEGEKDGDQGGDSDEDHAAIHGIARQLHGAGGQGLGDFDEAEALPAQPLFHGHDALHVEGAGEGAVLFAQGVKGLGIGQVGLVGIDHAVQDRLVGLGQIGGEGALVPVEEAVAAALVADVGEIHITAQHEDLVLDLFVQGLEHALAGDRRGGVLFQDWRDGPVHAEKADKSDDAERDDDGYQSVVAGAYFKSQAGHDWAIYLFLAG